MKEESVTGNTRRLRGTQKENDEITVTLDIPFISKGERHPRTRQKLQQAVITGYIHQWPKTKGRRTAMSLSTRW